MTELTPKKTVSTLYGVMGNKLKPCPFCGGKEIDVCEEGRVFGKSAYARTYLFVRCRKCYARTGIYGTKPKATEMWNRRAEDDKID